MALNTYVGARYVPKFFNNNGSSEWVRGVPYEALTIVTYLGNSYTSMMAVPSNAGAPNVATQYWVNTANYNVQVERYMQETESLHNVVDENTTEIENAVNNTVVKKNKKCVCIGDSYGTTNNNRTPWTQTILTKYPGSVNYSKGSSGFNPPDEKLRFINQLPSTVDPDVTDVIVCGGANDFISPSFESLISQGNIFVNRSKLIYPNATIHVGMIGMVTNTYMADLKIGVNRIKQVLDIYQQIKNTHYLSGIENILALRQDFITSDGVHPSNNGLSYLGLMIDKTISYGNAFINKNRTLTRHTAPSNYNIYTYEYGENSEVIIEFGANIPITTISNRNPINIGTVANNSLLNRFRNRTVGIVELRNNLQSTVFSSTALIYTEQDDDTSLYNIIVYPIFNSSDLPKEGTYSSLTAYANFNGNIW